MASGDSLVTVSSVARTLEISESSVRKLSDEGALPVERTSTGMRVFRVADVEELRLARAKGSR